MANRQTNSAAYTIGLHVSGSQSTDDRLMVVAKENLIDYNTWRYEESSTGSLVAFQGMMVNIKGSGDVYVLKSAQPWVLKSAAGTTYSESTLYFDALDSINKSTTTTSENFETKYIIDDSEATGYDHWEKLGTGGGGGVTSIDNVTGAITLFKDSTTEGDINFAMTDQQLGASIVGYTDRVSNIMDQLLVVAEDLATPASSKDLGGIKIGFVATGDKYPVLLDENDKAYVEVTGGGTAGVTSLGGATGTITLPATSITNGDVNLVVTNNQLSASVVGLKSAAYAEATSFANASHDHNYVTSFGTKTGAITLPTATTTFGDVNLSMTNNVLGAKFANTIDASISYNSSTGVWAITGLDDCKTTGVHIVRNTETGAGFTFFTLETYGADTNYAEQALTCVYAYGANYGLPLGTSVQRTYQNSAWGDWSVYEYGEYVPLAGTSTDRPITGAITSNSTITATAFYQSSDERLKNVHDEIDLNKVYDLIDKCSTILYDLKTDENHTEQVGMLAQEVEEFFPEIVATDNNGYKSLDYSRLSVIILRVMKDLIKRVEKLEK